MAMSSNPERQTEPVTVAMVIQNYLPTVGGAERQLHSLNPLFIDRGIKPTVYTRSRPGQPPTETLNGARVVRVKCVGPKPMQSIMFVLGTLWHLVRSRPDVVHAYDTLTPSLTAGLNRLVTGTPYMTKLLRSGELGDLNRLAEKPLGKARLGLLKRSVTKFVAISHDLEHELSDRGIDGGRRVFIPNGVDTERFKPPTSVAATGNTDVGAHWTARRDVFDDWPKAPVVVIVGRVSPEKRVIELAKSWNRVLSNHPDAWLYVVGEGPLSPQLDGLANVRFLGRREDVPTILRWSDVYVSASSAEGLSNALLEAMASGCPCVVTDVGGVADVMTDDVDGQIVGPEGPNRTPEDVVEDITDRIVKLLSDPGARIDLGRKARRAVVERYSLTSTADSLTQEYKTLGRSRAKP